MQQAEDAIEMQWDLGTERPAQAMELDSLDWRAKLEQGSRRP
jgi:hypothetical protein